jgi:hypothetical protein
MIRLKYIFLDVLMVLLAGIQIQAQTAACINPPSGMVGWWTGDNTTNDFFGISNG